MNVMVCEQHVRVLCLRSMAVFLLKGGRILQGTVAVPGAKNAALKLIAACLLTKEECVLKNLPEISDVATMLAILESMGAEIERRGREARIRCQVIDPSHLDQSLVARLRASVVFLGPLLARFGEAKIAYPGGDRIGARPLDAHLAVCRQLGAEVLAWGKEMLHVRREKPSPRRIILPEFSVTATENAMLAVARSDAETTIHIAAAEPHVQDLAQFLSQLGVSVQGAGTHTLVVRGKKELRGAVHEIIPDPLDAATFLIAGAATHGDVSVQGAREDHMLLVLEKLRGMGAALSVSGATIRARVSSSLSAARIQALPYPGIPSDLQALFAVLATQSQGESLIHDPLFEGRFSYLAELSRMGARAVLLDPHRAKIVGPRRLSGTTISSFDIRAGAAMVVAGLVAEGETVIEGIEHIDRGYEDLDGRLRGLGAEITRISN